MYNIREYNTRVKVREILLKLQIAKILSVVSGGVGSLSLFIVKSCHTMSGALFEQLLFDR